MKIKYNPDTLTQANINIVEPYRAKAQMGVSGYTINGTEISVNNKDVEIDEAEAVMDFAEDVKDFPVWLEIANSDLDTDIPNTISWSTYIDDNDNVIQRKFSDMTILANGTTKSIRYIQDETSSILKDDLKALKKAAKIKLMGLKDVKKAMADPNDEYYVEDQLL